MRWNKEKARESFIAEEKRLFWAIISLILLGLFIGIFTFLVIRFWGEVVATIAFLADVCCILTFFIELQKQKK